MKFILISKNENFQDDFINDDILSSNHAPSLISKSYVKKEFKDMTVYLYLYDEIKNEENSVKFTDDGIDFYNGFFTLKNGNGSFEELFDAIENDELIIGDYQAVRLSPDNSFIKTPQASLYPLFYYEDENASIISNELKLIVDGFRIFDRPFANYFNADFMEEYFHHGFFSRRKRPDYRNTIFKNITRILPQDEIIFDDDGKFTIRQKCEFDISEKYFECYEKDKDSMYDWYYGELLKYADSFLEQIEDDVSEIIVTLSGGFDSRLTVMLLHKLAGKHGITIKSKTDGLTQHPDVIIAEKVASKLGIEWTHDFYGGSDNLKFVPKNFRQYANTFFISQGDFDSHDYLEDYSRNVEKRDFFYQSGMDLYKRDRFSAVMNFNLWSSRRRMYLSNFYFPLFATNLEFAFSRIYDRFYHKKNHYDEFVYEILKMGNPDLLEIPFALKSLPQTDVPKFESEGYNTTSHKLEPFLWDYEFVLNRLGPALGEMFDEADTNHVLSDNGFNCLDYFLLKKDIDKILDKDDAAKRLVKLMDNAFYPKCRTYLQISDDEKDYIKRRSLMKLMDYACVASFNSFEEVYQYVNDDGDDIIEMPYIRIAELENEKQSLLEELHEGEKQIGQLEEELAHAKSVNDEIMNSNSWKITKPLRKIKKH